MTKVNAKTVLTRAQRVALFKVFQRDFPGWITPTRRREATTGEIVRVPSIQWRQFRARVQPAFGDTCVMLKWAGMWLGIERDGYTHS
jgi:hypothetical protein